MWIWDVVVTDGEGIWTGWAGGEGAVSSIVGLVGKAAPSGVEVPGWRPGAASDRNPVRKCMWNGWMLAMIGGCTWSLDNLFYQSRVISMLSRPVCIFISPSYVTSTPVRVLNHGTSF